MKHLIRVWVCLLLVTAAGFAQETPKPAVPEKKKIELNAEQKLVIREAQLELERARLQYQAERAQFERQWQERIAVLEQAVATIAVEKLREAGGDPKTHDLNDALIISERNEKKPEASSSAAEAKKPAAPEAPGASQHGASEAPKPDAARAAKKAKSPRR